MTTKNPTLTVQPYLSFGGRAEEAIEFYKKAIGAEVAVFMRFTDNPDGCSSDMVKPGTENNVMHAELKVGNATFMISDGCGDAHQGFHGISLALNAANPKEAERLFSALAAGGQIQMPLSPAFFSPAFGVTTDRFGVNWMVVSEPQ